MCYCDADGMVREVGNVKSIIGKMTKSGLISIVNIPKAVWAIILNH